MTRLTRRYCFSASHRLHSADLSEEENQTLYGKCNHPYGHGHDYFLEVTAVGPVDTVTGRIINPAALDRFVRARVLQKVDGRDLNVDVPDFIGAIPTTENLARAVAGHLNRQWPAEFAPATLERVFVRETDRNSFEVRIDELE